LYDQVNFDNNINFYTRLSSKTFTNRTPAQHNEVVKTGINNFNANDKTDDVSSQSKLKCWTCGGEHKPNVCPQRSNQTSNNYGKRNDSKRSDNSIQQSDGQNVGLVNDRSFGNSQFVVPAYLNGELIECYRDTGANVSVWYTRLVPTYAYTDECVEISGVTSVMQRVVLAKCIRVRHRLVIVGCLDNLPYDLLLGNAFFETNSHLCDVINSQNDSLVNDNMSHVIDLSSSQLPDNKCIQSVLPVVTRQQAAMTMKGSDNGVVIRIDRNSVECVSDCDVVLNCLDSCNISNSAVVSVDDLNVTNGVHTEMPEQSNINVTNK